MPPKAEIAELINAHLPSELDAHHLYYMSALACNRSGFFGFEQWLKKQAESDRNDARILKRNTESISREREIAADKRDQILSEKERDLLKREEMLAEDKIIISREKIFLADQRATLARGFAELRRKQNG